MDTTASLKRPEEARRWGVAIPYAWLNAVRGFSAYVVFVAHLVQIFWFNYVWLTSRPSAYAVMAFFALSGFFIAQSIKSNVRANGFFDFVPYFSARVARIYPPLIASLIVIAAVRVILVVLNREQLNLPDRPVFAPTFAQGLDTMYMLNAILDVNGPLWSLTIEFKLYMLAMGLAMLGFGTNWIVRGAGALLALWTYQQALNIYGLIWWISFALGLLQISNSNASLSKWARPLVASADHSYTLYIVHFPLLLGAWALLRGWQLTWPAKLAASLVLLLLVPYLAALIAKVAERKQVFQSGILSAFRPASG